MLRVLRNYLYFMIYYFRQGKMLKGVCFITQIITRLKG